MVVFVEARRDGGVEFLEVELVGYVAGADASSPSVRKFIRM